MAKHDIVDRLTYITKQRLWWGVAVTIAVAAALLLVVPGQVGGQIPDSLDLTGDVEASNCAPCHIELGAAKKPGLIFSHGNHLVVSCNACHYQAAHQEGKTYTPPMESCFNCHGIDHGPQGELATSVCADCHTPSFPSAALVAHARLGESAARRARRRWREPVHDVPRRAQRLRSPATRPRGSMSARCPRCFWASCPTRWRSRL